LAVTLVAEVTVLPTFTCAFTFANTIVAITALAVFLIIPFIDRWLLK
jgi:hypothetical protein